MRLWWDSLRSANFQFLIFTLNLLLTKILSDSFFVDSFNKWSLFRTLTTEDRARQTGWVDALGVLLEESKEEDHLNEPWKIFSRQNTALSIFVFIFWLRCWSASHEIHILNPKDFRFAWALQSLPLSSKIDSKKDAKTTTSAAHNKEGQVKRWDVNCSRAEVN